MADTKISALTIATTPLAGTEVLPIVQSGVTKQVSVADLTAGRAVSALSLTLTNALTAANGGTGQSSYAVGDLLYASTTTALSKLADVATGNALISGGVGVAPLWNKIGLTTHVSGTLPVANGGTGLTSLTANQVLYGSFSQSGNLVFDGTNLGIGTTPGGSYKLEISGTGKFGVSSDGVVYWGAAFTGNNRGFLTWDTNSAVVGGPQNLDFSTGGSNRVRVHTSGGFSIGNTTDPGATNLSVTGNINTAQITTSTGTVTAASGTATTMFTLSADGMYLVYDYLLNVGTANNTSFATVVVNNGAARIAANDGLQTTTLSGLSVQVTQSTGVNRTVAWSYTKVG